MKRSYLMRRPDSDEDEDFYGGEQVTNKPIDSRFASAFGGAKPTQFVRASAQSQREFYGKQELLGAPKRAKNDADDGDDQDDGGDDEPVRNRRPLTADERNKLSAKILKAELAGKKDKVKKLKKQLEDGFVDEDDDDHEKKPRSSNEDKPQEVQLMTVDKRTGLIQPTRGDPKFSGGKDRTVKSAVDGEYQRQMTLEDMVADEKKTSAEDQLEMFNRAAKMTSGNKVDDDWVVDDNIQSFKHKRRHEERDAKKEHSKRVAEHNKLEQTLDSCRLCIDSPRFDKLTLVAVGFKTYLAVVPWKGLDRFHCRIVPCEHYASQITVDEDVFAELRLWRKGLVAMFAAEDEDCVFIESAKNVKNNIHLAIECIPLPKESGDMAPIYFKQSLEQAGERWGTHRKIINLADRKDQTVRKAIPKGFSYFAIDFGLQAGYAHVIEKEDSFPAHFAQEIIAGMLDLDHKLWRRPEPETAEALRQKRDDFKQRWSAFDWTQIAKKRAGHQTDDLGEHAGPSTEQ